MSGLRALAAFALAVSANASILLAADTGTAREIDPSASKVEFAVQHIYVEQVTGTIPILRGTVVLSPGSTIPQSVSAVLDPTRIKTGEDDRDGALQTPDWFDSKRFPTWSFVSSKITPSGKDAFTMDGALTIHGVARSEHLDATVTGTPAHPLYRATGTIDRHAFGMTVTRLDPVIGNPVDVTLDIVLR